MPRRVRPRSSLPHVAILALAATAGGILTGCTFRPGSLPDGDTPPDAMDVPDDGAQPPDDAPLPDDGGTTPDGAQPEPDAGPAPDAGPLPGPGTLVDYGLLTWDPLESTCRHASLSIL